MGDFCADTEVRGNAGHYTARLSRDWEIWGPNGGYIAAIALRAAGAATALDRPASFSGHFLSVADFDVVDINVTTLRASRRAASLRVSMTQQNRPIFEAMVWAVGDSDGLVHDSLVMPDVASPAQLEPIEDIVSAEELSARSRFWNNFDERPRNFIPWAERRPGAPQWCEWYRFRPRALCDDAFADAARSLLLIDTMLWPAACQPHLGGDSGFVAPSLDVNATFHRLAPESEWLLVDAVAPVATDGLIGGQARVWSEDGRLLASGGGQLLCRPMPQP